RPRTPAPRVLAGGQDRALLLLARAGAYALTGLALGALMVAVALVLGLSLLPAHPGPGLGAHAVAFLAAGRLRAAASWGAACARAGARRGGPLWWGGGALLLLAGTLPLLLAAVVTERPRDLA